MPMGQYFLPIYKQIGSCFTYILWRVISAFLYIKARCSVSTWATQTSVRAGVTCLSLRWGISEMKSRVAWRQVWIYRSFLVASVFPKWISHTSARRIWEQWRIVQSAMSSNEGGVSHVRTYRDYCISAKGKC
jgi:hypothetical protein